MARIVPRIVAGFMALKYHPGTIWLLAMKTLILGGARSGKSHFAQEIARQSGLPVTYIATATAGDTEMAERIAEHRSNRPENWKTLEAPVSLAAVLEQQAGTGRCLLVDCLTLWLNNILGFAETAGVALENPELTFNRERQALFDSLSALPGEIILVSNDVGAGLVPADPASRRFRDEAGRLNCSVADCCESVFHVIAGLPQQLKGPRLE